MNFFIAIFIFTVALFLELVFVPKILGVFLPLSVWAAAAVFATFNTRRAVIFSLVAAFLETLFLPNFGGFFFFIFLGAVAAVFLFRHWFDGVGFVYDFAALVVALFFCEFLLPLVLVFLNPYGFGNPALPLSYGMVILPSAFIFDVFFVLFFGLILYFYESGRSVRRMKYV
ncbi:MAG: hypothetical protein Q7R91_02945 [bacterium]|nr:hypothetical protein [bacterium]